MVELPDIFDTLSEIFQKEPSDVPTSSNQFPVEEATEEAAEQTTVADEILVELIHPNEIYEKGRELANLSWSESQDEYRLYLEEQVRMLKADTLSVIDRVENLPDSAEKTKTLSQLYEFLGRLSSMEDRVNDPLPTSLSQIPEEYRVMYKEVLGRDITLVEYRQDIIASYYKTIMDAQEPIGKNTLAIPSSSSQNTPVS
ncbi:MAG: hypothetical protein AAB439_00110 [Patescibacteria group bacterium]